MLLENIKFNNGRAYKERKRGKYICRDYGLIKSCDYCHSDFFAKSKEYRFCTSDCCDKFMNGGNHHRWNGGRFIDRDGYVRVQTDKKSTYKLQHVLIIERDRTLICHICKSTDDMIIHHNDENRINNKPENLTVLCRPCHQRVHSVMRGNKVTKHYEETIKFLGEV